MPAAGRRALPRAADSLHASGFRFHLNALDWGHEVGRQHGTSRKEHRLAGAGRTATNVRRAPCIRGEPMSKPAFDTAAQQEVWDALQQINSAWLYGDHEALAELLHPEMVIVPPGFGEHITGRDACLAGYREFSRSAQVESYAESDANVDLFGDTAVVSYRYELIYTLADTRYQDAGQDVYVFVRNDGQWQAAWRALLSAAEG